eukprot:gene1113-2163_t
MLSIFNKSRRCLSTNKYFSLRNLSDQAVSNYLPQNVHLADVSVLQPEVKQTIAPQLYYFPTNDVPKSAPVLRFSEPGQYSDKNVSLNTQIFGMAIRKDIVQEVVRYQRHKMRQPKKTKRIGEISGSTKKPRPQKGTGAAQAGNRRASHWKGGQKAHGPVIRDYSIQLNRKYRALGMMVVLAAKLKEGNLIVFDSMEVKSHKTKDLATLLTSHKLYDRTALFVDDSVHPDFEMAARNMPLVTYMSQEKANVYDMMKRDRLVVTANALTSMQDRLMSQYTHRGKRTRTLHEAGHRETALAEAGSGSATAAVINGNSI